MEIATYVEEYKDLIDDEVVSLSYLCICLPVPGRLVHRLAFQTSKFHSAMFLIGFLFKGMLFNSTEILLVYKSNEPYI